MEEVFDTSSRTFRMHFSTTEIYPCCNYPIDLSWQQRSANVIDVIFKGVIDTNVCLAALGPATATIDFGSLSNGVYQLNFQNGEIRSSGKLVVSSDSYTVNFSANPIVRFTNSPLNKVPEHTVWGIVGYHKEETLPLVHSFFTSLINLGATKKSFMPGNYTAFEIDKNGDIVLMENHGYWFAQAFIFYYSGESSDIDKFLRNWSLQHNQEMSISINTDKGERFLSWMYK